jgi:hypothetical protein
MSISTKIIYVNRPTEIVTGSPVNLLQSSNGHIRHAGHQVQALESAVNGSDSQVTIRIASDGSHNAIMTSVQISSPIPVPTQPDVGGVTWSAVDRGQDITLMAPAATGSKREYFFDSPPQPAIKLGITVERT